MLISSYKNIHDSQDTDIELASFLEGVQSGKWQDIVFDVRNAPTKEIKDLKKKTAPLVTISGSFSARKDDAIRQHSGFIAIDIDNLEDAQATKDRIGADHYIYSCFLSIGGNGLCLIVKIDGTRHLDAFNGIAAYLYNEYQLIVDQSGKNVSRARFVSYDPFMLLNTKSATFKKYLPKKKEPKHPKVMVIKTDFDAMIKQMDEKGINLCEDYSDWVRICYALVQEFQEQGRDYFHTLSSHSSKYNSLDCDSQFTACLKNHSETKSKKSSIGTIYFHAKQNGIDIYSEHTKAIARFTTSQKAAGLSKEAIIETLEKQGGFSAEDSTEIVEQIVSKDIKFKSDSVSTDIAAYVNTFDLRKNSITRNIELSGRPIDDSDINSIFLDSKAVFKESSKDLVTSILFSNRISTYNPLHEFFEQDLFQPINYKYPNLDLLIRSVKSDTPNYDMYITRWLLSAVASAYGIHSPLVLIFCGEKQGTGKTHWFRYLLPKELRYLFAESKMDAGKDDEILMCKKWFILDDEYGGKSKKEDKRLKELTSKEFINVREPYGRVSLDLRRLAVFCGTSNETQLLNDPTGNRRQIPLHILDIDHDLYNQCDKAALWRELYALFQTGAEYTILKEDIAKLNASTEMFKLSTPEDDLINKKLSPSSETSIGEWMSLTDLQQYLMLETKFNYLNIQRIGSILTQLGFRKERRGPRGQKVMMYNIFRNYD
jgi:predicted P-loop ATPase